MVGGREIAPGARRQLCLAIAFACATVSLAGCLDTASPAERVVRAQRHVEGGEYRLAMIDLKTALAKEPDNRVARLALGEVSLTLGDLPSAERELRLAMQLGATADEAYPALARTLVAQRAYEKALTEIDPARCTSPDAKRDVYQSQGDALLELSRARDAMTAYESALALDAKAVGAHLGRARAHYEIGGMTAAKASLDAAYELGGTRPETVLAHAGLLLKDRQYAAAEALYAQLSAPESRTDPLRRQMALAGLIDSRLGQGNLGGAVASADAMLQAAPQDPIAMYLRARVHFAAGRHGEARPLLERILAGDPQNVPSRLLLGAVNLAQGNLGQADDYLTTVLAADPHNVLARRILAETRLRQDKPEAAIEILGPALATGRADLLPLAAAASLAAGDSDGGIALLDRGARASDPRTAVEIAAAYDRLGRRDRAIALLESLPAGSVAGHRRERLLIAAKLRERDMAGALAIAREIVERVPREADAHVVLGSVLLAASGGDEARGSFERALELDAGNLVAALHLARLDFLARKLDTSEARLRALPVAKQADWRIVAALADIEVARGRVDAALALIEQARERAPEAIEPRIALARFHLGARHFDRAVVYAREAVAISDRNPAAVGLLGLALAGAGEVDASAAEFERLVRTAPRSASARSMLARLYLAAGRADEAKRAVDASLALDPQFVPALALSAELAAMRGDIEGARGILAQIQKAEPEGVAAQVLAGDLSARQGDFAKAVQAYSAAAKRAPNSALAMREHAARRAGRLGDETAPLVKWLEVHPDDAGVRTILAQAEQGSGRTVEAIGHYERALAVAPDNVIALNNLAWLYHERRDARALDLARRAFERAPERAEIADTYGWMLLASGEVQQAIGVLEKAAAAEPGSAEIAFHYAAALHRAGRLDDSREVLTQALEDGKPFTGRADAAALLEKLTERS
jgi:cellulose synthase operon protein C